MIPSSDVVVSKAPYTAAPVYNAWKVQNYVHLIVQELVTKRNHIYSKTFFLVWKCPFCDHAAGSAQ